MRYGMCREELLQALRRRDLQIYSDRRGLVVVARSGAAGRLVSSHRFQEALTRERGFVALYLGDDDAALCRDPGGHRRHYRAAVDNLGEEYTACLVCGCQRLAGAPNRDYGSYRRWQVKAAV